MSYFRKELKKRQPRDKRERIWIFIPYDQLTDELGPLRREAPKKAGIVLVENSWKGDRIPYHKHKLTLILANMRHFGLEQAARGVAVRHVAADGHCHGTLQGLRKMEPYLGELETY